MRCENVSVAMNLIKLAALALTSPVHTADCERGFSVQNLIKDSQRNRLSEDKLQQLMTVSIEAPSIDNFNFIEVVDIWKSLKKRKIFHVSNKK